MRKKTKITKKNTEPIIYGDDGENRKYNFKLILTVIFIVTVIMIILQSKGYVKLNVGRR